MKEVTKYLCDRCNGEAAKTQFAQVNYAGRVIDLCPRCAREADEFFGIIKIWSSSTQTKGILVEERA